MAEVRALQDVGQFTASVDELREILTVSPDLPEANYRLGLALVQTGEPSRAIWPLQKAAESSEYAISAGVLLASTHFQTKNYDEAIHAADRVLEIDPERQAAMRIRANANLAARRLEASLEDTSRLVELYPDDYGVRALHATVLADLGRLDEAKKEHDLLKKMGEDSDDPDFRARSCLAPAVFAKDVAKDNERARVLYEDCASRNPTDPVVLNHLVGFFDSIDERERGTKLIRAAVESAPENLGLRQTLAMRLRSTGDPDGAEAVLREAVDSFGSAAAWNMLAGYYRSTREPEKALEAVEKVIELSGDDQDGVRFAHADILIDLGELERAEEVAASLETPTYAQLIQGRILLARGDPKGALEAFESGIRAWPNNAGARFLAGIAARDLGDTERALSEFREAVRADNAETDASLEIARIQLERGNYQQAVTFANMALRGPRGPQQSEAYVIATRAMTGLGQYERARRSTDVLRQYGHETIAAVERARVERAASGPAKSLEAIEASKLDVTELANIDLLRQSAESLVLLGRASEANRQIAAAIAKSPDTASLHELRGVVAVRQEDADAARSAFERAIELDDQSATAYAGLATLKADAGDTKGAVELFDRAAAAAPADGTYAYAAAQLVLASGDDAAAEKRLREIARHHPGVAGARNDLAWMLSERGEELDYALSLAKDAVRLAPAPEVYDTLGFVYLKREEAEDAVTAFERALEERPDSPSIRYRLATALSQSGKEDRARQELQTALAAGTFPEVEAARRELARLEHN